MDITKPPGIRLDEVFVLSSHIEHRDDVWVLPQKSSIEVPFRVAWRSLGKRGADQVMFQIRLDTEDDNDPMYRISVVMCAVVSRIKGQENMDPMEYAEDVAPAMMLPYLRSTVADLTRRARFGPIDVPPLNLNLAEKLPKKAAGTGSKKKRRLPKATKAAKKT